MSAHLARFRQSPGVLQRSFDKAAVATLPEERAFHLLRDETRMVWELLSVPRTLPGLVRLIGQSSTIDQLKVQAEAEFILDDLMARGLVEEVVDAET